MKLLIIAVLSAGFLLQSNVPPRQKVVTAAQVNGTWESKTATFKILALGKQRLKVQFSGSYPYKLPDGTDMANTGDADGIAMIDGNQAMFKPEAPGEECAIAMKFVSGKLLVEQEGTCGFGHNVSAAGTYRRVSSRKPKFERTP
jgi:hypothetical protein